MFEETAVGQVSDYMSMTGVSLVPKDNYYTFESLLDAPTYSLKGKPIGSVPALKTFEGKPWEVFKENQIIYDFTIDQIRLISSVTKTTSVRTAGNRFVSPGLILPGTLTEGGMRVKDYAAWYSRQTQIWLYSEISYV